MSRTLPPLVVPGDSWFSLVIVESNSPRGERPSTGTSKYP
jgi:hypothetical protein